MRERFEVALVADSEGTSWTGLDARRGQTSLMAFVAEGAFGDDTARVVEPRRSVRTRPGAIPVGVAGSQACRFFAMIACQRKMRYGQVG